MAERVKPNCCNSFGTGVFHFLNAFVFLLGIAVIVIMFVIKHAPTVPAGWGFILLGAVTALSGLFGTFCAGFNACCGFHLLTMLLSTAGHFTAAIVILVNEGAILNDVKHDVSAVAALDLIRVVGILFCILFVLQILIFFINCIVNSCCMLDFYEDLEGQGKPLSAKQAERAQKKAEQARMKNDASSQKILADKMKAKYGAYNSDPLYKTDA